VPSVSVLEIGVFFWSRTSPVSRPLSGQKIESPVSFSPFLALDDRPVDRRCAAIGGQQRRVILDRAVGRDVEEILRHEQGDEGHHLQVRLQRLELLPHLRVLVGLGLEHRQIGSKRRFLQRIGLGTGLLGRDIDADDVLTALDQRFQHGLAECLLAVNDDTHKTIPVLLFFARCHAHESGASSSFIWTWIARLRGR
jgi:hypothetical protein